MTVKHDHELITSDPYVLVRHPIYTGLLLALWRKLKLEERWMREQFGQQYEAYNQRVAALIPFVL